MCIKKTRIKIGRNYKAGEIRYNYKHKHYGHLKAIFATKDGVIISSVFLSSKLYDQENENVPLEKPLKINNIKQSFFIRRIRTYPASTYSEKYIENGLNKKDVLLSDTIYEIYLERKKTGTALSGRNTDLIQHRTKR